MKDAFCSHCGWSFPTPLVYPRQCANPACSIRTYANPIPESVVLVPVHHLAKTGLLVIRRKIEPQKGLLSLVGGFLEDHETWQQGGAREIQEETGITIDFNSLEPFWFTSTKPRPNRVLLFSIAADTRSSDFATFEPNHEISERGVIFGPDGLEEVFAFPLHAEAARRFFLTRSLTGVHDYTMV